MKIIDLTVTVDENTPVYPGDPKIVFESITDFEKYGMNDHKVSFGIHNGTHIDAPWHMVADGKKLDEILVEQFVGRGKLVEVKDKKFNLGAVKQAGIEASDIVLFNTGMSEVFHQPEYFNDRPQMSEEIANFLVERKVKMVGVDMCSPDKEPFPVHRILLGAEILIIENLTNLDELTGKEFTVYALPLKLQLDGAPARVIAEIDE